MRSLAVLSAFALIVLGGGPVGAAGGPTADDLAVPRYSHIFVIVEENRDYGDIIGSADAPALNDFAHRYGNASAFYGEVHPSEPNYVALLGGSTFGMHDDDAYYCVPNDQRPNCEHANEPGYVPHTVNAPHLGTQLDAALLTWKAYYESLPAPGSLAVTGTNQPGTPPWYAAKHAGFINYRSVQLDQLRAEHLVGLSQLETDLEAGKAPNFGLIIGNLCNDMHGMNDRAAPPDCTFEPAAPLIRRGDNWVSNVVISIVGSSLWQSKENAAVVITWDESASPAREGCCGVTPGAPSNFGGGHIPTIVITNHGPRGADDPTPYNHYALLRTIEDAFGIHTYLGLAAASSQGVKPMLPLFRTAP
jgi:hypothetical protein